MENTTKIIMNKELEIKPNESIRFTREYLLESGKVHQDEIRITFDDIGNMYINGDRMLSIKPIVSNHIMVECEKRK